MKKLPSTIQLPQDLWEKMEEIKKQWGSSHNFQIEMALRTYFKEDLAVVFKNMRCPHCKKPIFNEK